MQVCELLFATKARCLGRRAYTHAILGDHLKFDQPLVHQGHHGGCQLCVQPGLLSRTEVRQAVVVDPHATADPAVRVIALAQARQLSGRAHPLDRGQQPKRYQDRWIDRRCATPTLQRLDLRVQRRQIQRLNESPDAARGVIAGQHRIQVHRAQFDLVALCAHDSRWRGPHGRRRPRSTRRASFFTEQTTLALFTRRTFNSCAHALYDGSTGHFVHTF